MFSKLQYTLALIVLVGNGKLGVRIRQLKSKKRL